MDKKPAIIFDLDGTLADTAPDLLTALNHSLRSEKFPQFGMDEIGHLVGHGSLAMIRRAFELQDQPLSDDHLADLHRDFLHFYEANIAVHSALFDYASDLLAALQERDYPLCVCTNKYEKMANQLLQTLDVKDLFVSVTGGDTFEFRKPDKRHLLETLALANCNPKHAIMIGDTITDANAARNAGIPLILVDFGYSEIPIADLLPDQTLSHFKDGLKAIEEISANHFGD